MCSDAVLVFPMAAEVITSLFFQYSTVHGFLGPRILASLFCQVALFSVSHPSVFDTAGFPVYLFLVATALFVPLTVRSLKVQPPAHNILSSPSSARFY